ncbi:hypothetical protein QJS10_CPA09g02028 [Acorus calamus]|uniref:Reverse transcriptase zinc-binding domain-containing protein n=1 Tax=Acorus calamus TaxID=4465 RepID=A0AAV9DTZ9_ACOCL|nr:hypothetical protein QJS10_CPB11g01789 [Acorus calamus]KAK1307736.1 hypothetical protein QJS10_CPA09g02028 [Acorus calamus]
MTRKTSWIWKGILDGLENFNQGTLWRLGSGKEIRFWHDIWVGDIPLKVRFSSIFLLARVKQGAVCLFRRGRDGARHWDVKVKRALSEVETEELQELLEVLRQGAVLTDCDDVVVWKSAKAAGFTVKKGYEWLRRGRPIQAITGTKSREIWGCKAPLKVKFFLWILYQRRTLTRSRLVRWNSGLEEACALCGEEAETADHLFTSCQLVRWVWDHMKEASGLDVQFRDLEGMWRAGKQMRMVGDRSVKAKMSQLLVPATVWAIWLSRNQVIFGGQRPYAENIWELAKNLIIDWGNYCVGARGISFQTDKLVIP